MRRRIIGQKEGPQSIGGAFIRDNGALRQSISNDLTKFDSVDRPLREFMFHALGNVTHLRRGPETIR